MHEIPRKLSINKSLKLFQFSARSTINKSESAILKLEIIGCFKNITGCIVNGKHYENHQLVNGTANPDKCSSEMCYCKDHKVTCRTSNPKTICAENEIKSCSKVNKNLECCTCVKNVNITYCQIDYLCNPHCGNCLDEGDTWGKETIVQNATQCNCKDGYQSFIESYEDKVESTSRIHINAKCMSYTIDESTCGTTSTPYHTVTRSTPTISISSSTSIQNTTTVSVPTSTISISSSETTRIISSSSSTTTTTTTTTVTPPITHTISSSSTTKISTFPETEEPTITTTNRPLCTYMFCSQYTCDNECVVGESRIQDCSKLVCTGRLTQVFKNETYIICTRKKQENCASTPLISTKSVIIPSSTISNFTVLPTFIPPPTSVKPCVVVFCTVYTCDKLCLNPSYINEYCYNLNCTRGYKEVTRNSTHVQCAQSIDINCKSTTLFISTTTTLPITTTIKPSECEPEFKLNTEKYIAEIKKSTNLAGNELDSWVTSTEDFVPLLEIRFKNSMTVVKLVFTEMTNVQEMNILTSEDGKTNKISEKLVDQYRGYRTNQTVNFQKTTILSLKLIVLKRVEISQPITLKLTVIGCGKVCLPPLIHVNCSCQQTCDLLAENKGISQCPSKCIPGCQCPEGMVNNNGKCVKVSECPCYYNGRTYAFGDKIPTENPCKVLICTKESLQEISVGNCTTKCKETMIPCACEGCHKTCNKNNMDANCDLKSCKSGCCCPPGTVYSEILEKCVKQCPCIYNNQTYTVGEKWKNQCLDCKCDELKGAYCIENGCHFDQCPSRYKLVNESPNDNICCKCVKLDPVCIFNEKEYTVGEIWSDGPCRTFKCIIKEGNSMVITNKLECPRIKCPPTHIPLKLPGECCDKCFPKNITTTILPTTTSQISTKCHKVSNYTTIQLDGCVSKNLVDVGACKGLCESGSYIDYAKDRNSVTRDCNCCNANVSSILVDYVCPGNIFKQDSILIISNCDCKKCG